MYRKRLTTKIIRVKHIIEFNVGTQAKYLKKWLEQVPDEATIDEVLDTSIEFHEEKLDEAQEDGK
jgi:hypothetical protein